MRLHNILAAISRIGLSVFHPRPPAFQGNVFSRLARYLVAVDARARERRRLANVPDWVRADAVLPPHPKAEQGLPELFVQATLLGRR